MDVSILVSTTDKLSRLTKARWYRVQTNVVVLDPSERNLHHGHRPPSIHAPHIGEKCTYLMVILHAEAVGKISISFPLVGDPFQKMVDCGFHSHLHIHGGEPYAARPCLLPWVGTFKNHSQELSWALSVFAYGNRYHEP